MEELEVPAGEGGGQPLAPGSTRVREGVVGSSEHFSPVPAPQLTPRISTASTTPVSGQGRGPPLSSDQSGHRKRGLGGGGLQQRCTALARVCVGALAGREGAPGQLRVGGPPGWRAFAFLMVVHVAKR